MSVTVGMCEDCGEHRWPLGNYQDMWLCLQCLQDRVKAAQVIAHAKKNREWTVYELIGGQLYVNGKPAWSSGQLSQIRFVLDLFERFNKLLKSISLSIEPGHISVIYRGDATSSDVQRMAMELAPAGILVDVSHAGL